MNGRVTTNLGTSSTNLQIKQKSTPFATCWRGRTQIGNSPLILVPECLKSNQIQ